MNSKKSNRIVWLISATIVATIVIQFYWNYKNYLENKKRVTNEIQISLDNALDEYYSNISKNNFFTIINIDSLNNNRSLFTNWMGKKKDTGKVNFKINSIEIKTDNPEEYKKMPRLLDSIFFDGDSLVSNRIKLKKPEIKKTPFQLIRGKRKSDSLRVVKGIQSVYIALNNDKIDFGKLDSLFKKQLNQKEISVPYYFELRTNDSLIKENHFHNKKYNLQVFSKSSYLRDNQKLAAYYSNPSIAALKKSSFGIFLSLILALSVIFSLVYLLKVINKQKELAEIKNDLISNITHEFKTPIATVSTALEAIESFNVLEDKDKTQKYLSMSSNQLKKLHLMVEKLLETATLDSEKLILKKEEIDINSLIEKIVSKHQNLTNKSIHFSTNLDAILCHVDTFHFENAISNLIDNAIKYGGDTIQVNSNKVLNEIEISIADNGKGIDKNQQEKIFDKFYRVPKGNTHDVKGFGIGLYYTKAIVEKHGGQLNLNSNTTQTVFKITLPNE